MNVIIRLSKVVAVVLAVGIAGAEKAQAATKFAEGVIPHSGGGAAIVDWVPGTRTVVNSAPAASGSQIYHIGDGEYSPISTSGGMFAAPIPENYWLAGSDPGDASSMNMSGSSVGWATSSTGTKVSHMPTQGNIYHIGTNGDGTARLLRTPTTPVLLHLPRQGNRDGRWLHCA